MDTEITGLLTVLVFLPLIGAISVAILGKTPGLIKLISLMVVILELGLGGFIFTAYDTEKAGLQFVDFIEGWISVGSFKVDYFLGLDGVSVPFVLLTSILGLVAVLASWNIKTRVREYFVWILVLQTAIMGVFTSLDFLLFFVFWEIELVPMFLLISIWGTGRKEYSAMKFLIYTFFGSAFMLVGILALFFTTGTFNMTELPLEVARTTSVIPIGLIFFLLFIRSN